MKLVQHYLTKNPCYKAGRTLTVKGLMLHSIGVNQPDATVFLKTWDDPSYNNACVHGFIDANDGTIYQTLPWNMRGWHCARSANNTHIGVEMCEPKGIRYYKGSSKFEVVGDVDEIRHQVTTTYTAAVELFAHLCALHKLDPKKPGVILSHHEGYLAGVASNHGDPEHLWGKKSLNLIYTMDMFRDDVKRAMERQNGSRRPAPPFKIQISSDNVWVRTGPSLAYPQSKEAPKVTGKGVFTIVEVVGDFGRLKSGAGWVNLANHDVAVV